jgi:hypothetical protein
VGSTGIDEKNAVWLHPHSNIFKKLLQEHSGKTGAFPKTTRNDGKTGTMLRKNKLHGTIDPTKQRGASTCYETIKGENAVGLPPGQ